MKKKNINIIAKKLGLRNEDVHIISFIIIALIALLCISHAVFSLFIKSLPFMIFIPPIFLLLRSRKKKKLESESILQKRIKRFKSMKRGYYSFVILLVFYILSLITPLWMNNKPLMISFANNSWDIGEIFTDMNKNEQWDEGEPFIDEHQYYFPAIRDFFSFIPGVQEPFYESQTFNQDIVSINADFRLLEKSVNTNHYNTENYVIMPFYIYHPHEDLKDELDEEFVDMNKNEQWDEGEPFIDENDDGKWSENNPPTLPSDRHIAGTDTTGRDVFSRLIDGYKISMTFALVVTTLSYIIGIIIGATLGYFGGRVDLFGVRLIEIFSAIPFLFMLMILGNSMKPGIFLLALLAVILKGWIGITMYIRGEFFREKPKDYVSAAVSMGQSNWKIMFKHILPNSLTPIVTFAPFSIIADIGTLVSLDFLGYGLTPPASSWGHLLQQGSENLEAYHLLIFPILIMTLTIFMITFISEGVREAFDPKVYSRLR